VLDRLNIDNRLPRLQQQIRNATVLTRGLMLEIAARAGTRYVAAARAGPAKRVRDLIEAEAWTDAALALIELELPQWRLRRLTYEDGLWHCSLSKQPELPAGLDEMTDASHEILPLAILGAFVEARSALGASAGGQRSVPQVRPTQGIAACCDNFA
jgi:hypothetical protein